MRSLLLINAILFFAIAQTGAVYTAIPKPDVCHAARTAVNAEIPDDVRTLLVIDNFACSKCVQELVKSSSIRLARRHIGVIISTASFSQYAPSLRKLDCKIVKLSSEEIQKCLFAEYSIALYRRTANGYSLIMDVPVDGVQDALDFIENLAKSK